MAPDENGAGTAPDDEVTAAAAALARVDAADVAASGEDLPGRQYLDVGGVRFLVAEKIGAMPLMLFARSARQGADSTDLDALFVMYELLQDVIDESQWARFVDHVTRLKYDGDEIFGVVQQAWELISARPTGSRSGSSSGPSTTSLDSNGTSGPAASGRSPETSPRPDPQRERLTSMGIGPMGHPLGQPSDGVTVIHGQ